MSFIRYRLLLLQFIYPFLVFTAYSNGILNPKEYGLDKAKDDIERYYILLQCHQDAAKFNKSISYKGIKNIHIEIPADAVSIPLPQFVDFSNVNLYVRNTSKVISLFEQKSELTELSSLSGSSIDKGFYKYYKGINNGTFILVIEDETPWVLNRKGYDYGANRHDIIFVVDGRGKNKPIASYRTAASKPLGKYCVVNKEKKIIKNLHFYRTIDSSEITYLCRIQNQYNLLLQNH